MRFEGTLLVVKDMAVSRRFHEELFAVKAMLDLGVYVVFEGGYCLLTEGQWREFQDNRPLDLHYGNHVCQITFETEDLDAFLEHLKKFPDVRIQCPVKEYEWGQRSIRVFDPDGHIVEVGEDMKVVTKRYLRSGMSVEETTEKVMFPPAFVEMCKKELDAE